MLDGIFLFIISMFAELPPCCMYSFSLQSYGIGKNGKHATAMRRKIDGSLPNNHGLGFSVDFSVHCLPYLPRLCRPVLLENQVPARSLKTSQKGKD